MEAGPSSGDAGGSAHSTSPPSAADVIGVPLVHYGWKGARGRARTLSAGDEPGGGADIDPGLLHGQHPSPSWMCPPNGSLSRCSLSSLTGADSLKDAFSDKEVDLSAFDVGALADESSFTSSSPGSMRASRRGSAPMCSQQQWVNRAKSLDKVLIAGQPLHKMLGFCKGDFETMPLSTRAALGYFTEAFERRHAPPPSARRGAAPRLRPAARVMLARPGTRSRSSYRSARRTSLRT